MDTIPQHIRQIFFEVMIAEMTLPAFENWVYKSQELEAAISEQLYLDLISLNYKKNGAKYELFKLLEKNIDTGEYETYKLKKLLNSALKPNLELPRILEKFYDMYCNGYSFLNVLGLHYGLTVTYLPGTYSTEHWSELPEEELQQLADNLFTNLPEEVLKVEQWLNNKDIILTGQQDELGHYKFIDNRVVVQRQSIYNIPAVEPSAKR